MGFEDFDQALVFSTVFLEAFKFIAGRPECAAGCMAQASDSSGALFTGVEQVFGQRADNAIAASLDLADFIFVFAGRFDDTAGAGIDD